MDVKRERTEPILAVPLPPSASSSVSAVLGNDDLLREIMLRLGFPTTLVRAALAAKRWLRHASDPAFLRCFRERHPPALLGFYVSHAQLPRPQFVPVSQAPELATAARRAGFDGGPYKSVADCRNGRGLIWASVRCIGSAIHYHQSAFAVLNLLQPTPGVVLIPPPTLLFLSDGIFLPEDNGGDEGGDGVVAVELVTADTDTRVYAEVYTFQSGVWTERTTPEIEVLEPAEWHWVCNCTPPAQGKIYMSTDPGGILILDLAATSLSLLQLPSGVTSVTNMELLCAGEDSGLFLVHAEGFLLSVWHHKADGNGTRSWVLVHDKITVHEACNRREDVFVMGVDRKIEYVFLWLEASKLLMHMHLKSRNEKVYDELTLHDRDFFSINPFMMVWPPVFPALKEESNLEE